MKALIIGYGSVGSRHTRILARLGCEVAVVSSRNIHAERCFPCISKALQKFDPKYVVIASETARHLTDVVELATCGFNGTVLVEKPLFAVVSDLPENCFSCGYVAYNLRFHPLIVRLKERLAGENILSVQAYVGQYLPTWRPDQDYRQCYSAKRDSGGGALRDLSHELDYLNWLLGGWLSVTALGGHFSPLEITSDDVFAIMLTTKRCPVVTVQLNYLDRQTRREIVINTAKRTISVDFVTGRLSVNADVEEFKVERDATYQEMHAAILGNHQVPACTLAEGVDVVNLIASAELAVVEGRWINR